MVLQPQFRKSSPATFPLTVNAAGYSKESLDLSETSVNVGTFVKGKLIPLSFLPPIKFRSQFFNLQTMSKSSSETLTGRLSMRQPGPVRRYLPTASRTS